MKLLPLLGLVLLLWELPQPIFAQFQTLGPTHPTLSENTNLPQTSFGGMRRRVLPQNRVGLVLATGYNHYGFSYGRQLNFNYWAPRLDSRLDIGTYYDEPDFINSTTYRVGLSVQTVYSPHNWSIRPEFGFGLKGLYNPFHRDIKQQPSNSYQVKILPWDYNFGDYIAAWQLRPIVSAGVSSNWGGRLVGTFTFLAEHHLFFERQLAAVLEIQAMIEISYRFFRPFPVSN